MNQPEAQSAERALLGAVLLDERVLSMPAVVRLAPAHFGQEAHRLIWGAMRSLADKGRPIDQVTLGDALLVAGHLAATGGPAYLISLENATPTASNAEHYAALVYDAALVRHVERDAAQLGEMARSGVVTGADLAAEVHKRALALERPAIREARGIRDALVDANVKWEALHDRPADVTGVPTGLHALDRMTAGLHPGQLVILAARSGRGKTSLALRILVEAARAGYPALLFSLEMPEGQIVDRIVSSEGQIDGVRLRTGWLRDEDWMRLGVAQSELGRLPLWIDAAPAPGLLDLRASAMRVQAKAPGQRLGLVVVDYLQIVRASGRRDGNREQEVAEVARGLKALARTLDVPVLALSQMSRGIEREKRRPQLSDLRESGAIEQEADVVAFIWQAPEGAGCDCRQDVCEIVVGKQRNGPTGEVHVRWIEQFARHENPESSRPPEGWQERADA